MPGGSWGESCSALLPPTWNVCPEEVKEASFSDQEVLEVDNDSVFEEEPKSVPEGVINKENESRKEGERKNSYENQDKAKIDNKNDNKATTKLLKMARDRVRDSEHMLTVADEKVKAYKKEAAVKDAQIAREKAAVRHWRNTADAKQVEIEKLSAELKKLEADYERVLDRCEEITQDYEYLSNLYDKELDKPKKTKVSRKYAKRDN